MRLRLAGKASLAQERHHSAAGDKIQTQTNMAMAIKKEDPATEKADRAEEKADRAEEKADRAEDSAYLVRDGWMMKILSIK